MATNPSYYSPNNNNQGSMNQYSNIPVAQATAMDASSFPAPPVAPPAVQHEQQPLSTAARNILKEQGYTNGLIEALEMNKRAFPVSYWVVDNSGSMATADGHRIMVQKNGHLKFTSCSRWKEMQETVDYHSQLAAVLQSPTTFRLLNDPGAVAGPQTFRIAHSTAMDHDLSVAQSVMMNAQPAGVTPLAQHILAIRNEIQYMNLQGGKVAVVLATDGLPTDERGYSNAAVKQQFVDTLRSLEGMPVWVVVRLCTDQDDVVQYWNNLDGELELSLEVLDDFVAEAEEVREHNNWLNYALPLHRMRELGFYHKMFDLLDERTLSKGDLKDFMSIIFGHGVLAEAPDPEGDWKGFCDVISNLLTRENKQWNPITKRLEPWIDMRKLKQHYGGGSFFGLF